MREESLELLLDARVLKPVRPQLAVEAERARRPQPRREPRLLRSELGKSATGERGMAKTLTLTLPPPPPCQCDMWRKAWRV